MNGLWQMDHSSIDFRMALSQIAGKTERENSFTRNSFRVVAEAKSFYAFLVYIPFLLYSYPRKNPTLQYHPISLVPSSVAEIVAGY
jgi:hypothetical protein